MTTGTLIADALSGNYLKGQRIPYALKGSIVIIISYHDNVVIVEFNNNRFPTLLSNIKLN